MGCSFVLLLLSAFTSIAEVRTWNGNAGDRRWSNVTNWVGETLPAPGDDVVAASVGGALQVDVPIALRSFTLAANSQLRIDGVAFEVSGDWVVPSAQVRVVSNGVLRASSQTRLEAVDFVLESNARLELPALVELGNSTFDVSGGAQFVAPPTVTTVNCQRPNYGSANYSPAPLFRAQGAGSRLDLRSVRSIALSTGGYVGIEALGGGRLDLSACESLVGSRLVVSVRDQGELVADRLTVMDGVRSGLIASLNIGVARQTFPALTLLNYFTVQLYPEGLAEGAVLALPKALEIVDCSLGLPDHSALETPVLERLTQTDVVLAGSGTLTVAALQSVERSTFDLSAGARLVFPAAIDHIDFNRPNYGGANYAPAPLFRVRGAGSFLDLRSVRTLISNSGGYVAVEARDGGELDLSQCESVNGFHYALVAASLGRLKLDRLAALECPQNGLYNLLSLAVEQQDLPRLERIRSCVITLVSEGVPSGVTVTAPALQEIADSSLDLPEASELRAPGLQRLVRTDVQLQGTAALSAAALRLVDGSTFDVVNGAQWALPAAIDRFEYRRQTGSNTPEFAPVLFRARGTGSRLDLRSLRSIVVDSSSYMAVAAMDGGELDLSRCEIIAGSSVALRQFGNGVLRLEGLTDLQGTDRSRTTALHFDTSQFALPALRFARGLWAEVGTARRLSLGTGEVATERATLTLADLGELTCARLLLHDGELTGSGTVVGEVVNGGVIDPGQRRGPDIGVLTLHGNLLGTPEAVGVVHVDLVARNPLLQDRLVVDGDVDLGQILELSAQSGYVPGLGDTAIPVEWSNGAFGQLAQVVNDPRLSSGEWATEVLANAVQVTRGAGRPPVVLATSPAASAALPFTRWQVVFNEAIEPTSFTTATVQLRSPDDRQIPAVAIQRRDSRTYEVIWEPQTQAGTYRLELASSIRDLAGFTLEQAFSTTLQLSEGPTGQPGLVILQQPSTERVGVAGGVAFSVTAQGAEPLSYQWYKNGARLSGATNATWIIARTTVADGGTYSVVVANPNDHLESHPAQLEVVLPEVAMADRFADRPTYTSPSFAGITDTRGAGSDTGEPRHAGKVGGKSVWLTWRAPGNGVVEFTTAGSSFDTLLAVYRGKQLGELAANDVAHDDDAAGFLTSRVRFTAVAGVDYQIAVDGYAGASGRLALGWNFESDALPLPQITAQPNGVLAPPGIATELTVAASGSELRYQWYKEGALLPGATQPTLSFSNLENADAGLYRVGVRSGTGPEVRSDAVTVQVLQRGPVTLGLQDKIEEFFQEDLAPANRAGAQLQGVAPPAFASVSFGVPGGLAMNNGNASRQEGEELPCAVAPDGATLWWRLRPAQSGSLTLDTFGSRVDTVVSLYRGLKSRVLVGCNDDHNPTDGTSELRVEVVANEDYFVQVDSINGRGLIVLNWGLGGGAVETPVVLVARFVEEFLELKFQANPGPFHVEGTADLVHWESVNQGTSTGAEATVRLPRQAGVPGIFYRVVAP